MSAPARALRPWQSPAAYPRRRALGRGRGIAGDAQRRYDDLFNISVAIPSLAPGASATVPVNIQLDAMFEWVATTGAFIMSNSVAQFSVPNATIVTVNIQDQTNGRFISNIPVPMAAICGFSGFPHILPIPKRFIPNATVTFTFTNTDSALTVNSGFFTMLGRKLFSPQRDNSVMSTGNLPRFNCWQGVDGKWYSEDYFLFDFRVAQLAITSTSNISIIMDQMADFEWIEAIAASFQVSTTTGSSQVFNDLVTVQISDGQSDRRLFSAALPVGCLYGVGTQPGILPQTRIFERCSTVKKTISNLGTGGQVINELHLIMEGRKIFEQDEL